MDSLKLSPIIDEKEIAKRVKEIGLAISDRCGGEPIVAICVLRGSFVFYADLIREIDAEVACEFFGVSSYENEMQSSGEVKLTLDLSTPISGKNVVLVEDIVDTGLTMNYLIKSLEARNPKSITTVSFLQKPDAMKVECKVDFVGFKISNDFVVGYGLDYQGYYRNLPYVAQVQNIN